MSTPDLCKLILTPGSRQRAYSTLAEKVLRKLWRWKKSCSPEEIEDAFAEALHSLIKKSRIAGYQVNNCVAWLKKTTENELKNLIEKKKREADLFEEHQLRQEIDGKSSGELKKLDEILQHLKPKCVQRIQLRLLDNLKFAQIAEIVGDAGGNSSSSMFRKCIHELRNWGKKNHNLFFH